MIFLIAAVFVPFFLGALAIGACFSVAAGGVFRLYFVNLAGSAAGCLLLFLTWLHLEPFVLLLSLSLLAVCASGIAARGMRRALCAALALLLMPLLYGAFFQGRPLEMSPVKDLAQARSAEGAVTEHQRFGPLGLVTVLSGPSYHYLPDLSLRCPHRLPEQKGLFIDGNAVGEINRFCTLRGRRIHRHLAGRTALRTRVAPGAARNCLNRQKSGLDSAPHQLIIVMAITKVTSGENLEMSVTGRIDGAAANELEVEILAAIRAGTREIFVNLSQAEWICSAGIRVLLQYFRQMKNNGKKLLVTAPRRKSRPSWR